MPAESEPAPTGYWGHEPIGVIARARRVTAEEIAELDRVFRDTSGIGRAWIHAYFEARRYAASWDYVGDHLWHFYELRHLMDEAREAVWSAAAVAGSTGFDHSRRTALEERWSRLTIRADQEEWDSIAAEPGALWGAALAVECAVLGFATMVQETTRALVRPWEAVIGAVPPLDGTPTAEDEP